jgi:hypothetical protein
MWEAEMIRARDSALGLLVLMLVFSACAKKSTRPEPEYRGPLAFDLYKWHPELGKLDSNYVRRVYEAWDNELRDDVTIKNHTWLVGDYKVLVYYHGYIEGMRGTRHDEVVFFTTTKPKSSRDKVHCTITPFSADFRDTNQAFSKIQTYVYAEKYRPIKGGEEAAINLMIEYLDQYIAELGQTPLTWVKKSLQRYHYAWEWGDHYVYYESPGDFGGAIIVNKLTSKLDFLGSSVWFGPGMRYLPPTESSE